MTTVAVKSIAAGEVPTTTTTVYTVAASTKAYLRQLILYNAGLGSATVTVYLTRSGGSARVIDKGTLASGERGVCFDGSALTLSTGDAISLVSTATLVDYTLCGAEEA